MEERTLDAVYLSNGVSFAYFTGYHYLVTERPAAIVIKRNGDIDFFGPAMEGEHIVSQTKLVDKVYTYLDYPGEVHPIRIFSNCLNNLE